MKYTTKKCYIKKEQIKDYKELLRMQGELTYKSEAGQNDLELYEYSGYLDWLKDTCATYGKIVKDWKFEKGSYDWSDYILEIEYWLEDHLEMILGLKEYKDKMWTSAIIITNQNDMYDISYYPIHGEHECDMVNFLLSKPERNNRSIGRTGDTERIHWFNFNLTEKDIESIKETAWYKNTKNYCEREKNIDFDSQLIVGNNFEVFMV